MMSTFVYIWCICDWGWERNLNRCVLRAVQNRERDGMGQQVLSDGRGAKIKSAAQAHSEKVSNLFIRSTFRL